uniref:Endo-beta-N-acetylglucosaminidase n=1 Tax=Mus musculus TaxID=10090 RepID=E9PY27_MOUSE
METSSVLTRGAARQRSPAAPEKQARDQTERRPGRRRQGRRINEDQEEEAVFREVVSFTPDPLPDIMTRILPDLSAFTCRRWRSSWPGPRSWRMASM